ncbi:YrzE family protein [Arthrobacter sp. Ld5]|uniref:YrzE family protein n=1 Tax=Arthrobacter sp. Ld5 TaxID=649152 RepID=UPI003EB8E405
MSTPATGNTDGDRRDAAGPEHTQDNPTELMDTHRAGTGDRGASAVAPSPAQGGGTDGGRGYESDDDAGGYVPGMYSDSPADTADSTPTRRQAPPISASRETRPAEDTTTRPHTQVAPAAPAGKRSDRGTTVPETDHHLARGAAAASGVPSLSDRKLLHQREKEHFGGMRFGSAFFGWLTATGMFVLLSALVGGLASLFGVGGNLSTTELTSGSGEAQSAAITTAVVLGIMLLVAYYTGGYVAGRMARFSGAKQGVAVWLWAVIVTLVLAIIGLVVGNQANVTERVQDLGLPSLQDFTGPGLLVLLVVAAIALAGAVLGGLAGMRYHRRIDRADFDALDEAP